MNVQNEGKVRTAPSPKTVSSGKLSKENEAVSVNYSFFSEMPSKLRTLCNILVGENKSWKLLRR